MKIVISVIVSVGAICIVIGLTLWILWRKRRNRSPYLLGHSVVMTTNSSKLNEVANIDSTSEIMPVSPNQCEENAPSFVAGNCDSISVMDGGFVWDSIGRYVLYVPPQGSTTSPMIKASCCEHGFGTVLALSDGTKGIPVSVQLQLEPDGFRYNKPAQLFLRINDDVCSGDLSKLRLWYMTEGDTQYTRCEDEYCRVIQKEDGWYFTCLIRHHCKVVLCREICQIQNIYMGIYTHISRENIRNLHVVLTDNHELVKNAANVLFEDSSVIEVKDKVLGPLPLEAGLHTLEINLTDDNDPKTTMRTVVCHCKLVPDNVHQCVFPVPSVETCTLKVTATDVTAADPDSYLVCEEAIPLNALPWSSTPNDRAQNLEPHVITWCDVLARERQKLPLCHRRKTKELQAQNNHKMNGDLIDVIGEHIFNVGVTMKQLCQMAEKLDPTVASKISYCNELDDADNDNEASLDNVQELLTIASTERVSLEQVLGCFMGVCSLRAEFFDLPDCGDINEEALHGFQNLIVQIMEWQCWYKLRAEYLGDDDQS
jgi:hypothetical protein